MAYFSALYKRTGVDIVKLALFLVGFVLVGIRTVVGSWPIILIIITISCLCLFICLLLCVLCLCFVCCVCVIIS